MASCPKASRILASNFKFHSLHRVAVKTDPICLHWESCVGGSHVCKVFQFQWSGKKQGLLLFEQPSQPLPNPCDLNNYPNMLENE